MPLPTKKTSFSIKLNKVKTVCKWKGPNVSVCPASTVGSRHCEVHVSMSGAQNLNLELPRASSDPPKNVTQSAEGREVSNLRLMRV